MKSVKTKFTLLMFAVFLFSMYAAQAQTLKSMNPGTQPNPAKSEVVAQRISSSHLKKAELTLISELPVKENVSKKQENSSTPTSEVQKPVPNYHNSGSYIFTDLRTPRFPLSSDEKVNIANYEKAKTIWISNNPQLYKEMTTAPVLTEEQRKVLEQKRKSNQ